MRSPVVLLPFPQTGFEKKMKNLCFVATHFPISALIRYMRGGVPAKKGPAAVVSLSRRFFL